MASDNLELLVGKEEIPLSFKSFDEIKQWLQREHAIYDWLSAGEYDFAAAGKMFQRNIVQLINQVEAIKTQGAPLSAAHQHLMAALNPDGWLPYSKSALGEQLLAIRERAGDAGAIFAYGYTQSSFDLQNANRKEHVLAVMLLAMPELNEPVEIAERLKRERTSYRSSLTSAIKKIDDALEHGQERFDHELRRGRALGMQLLRKLKQRNIEAQSLHDTNQQTVVASIQAVENAYREAMGLQAPVEYWEKKAKAHSKAEGKARGRLFWYFPIAAALLVAGFFGASWILLRQGEVAPTVYILVAAGLGSLAALSFWVGRLLTKLYLSEHHLRLDAEERAVMTTTYLALTHEQAATQEDKDIILAALFRATTDGLVKDDGPPDLTLATLLSRVGGTR